MANTEHDTPGGAAPDQTPAPEPPAAPLEDGTAAPPEGEPAAESPAGDSLTVEGTAVEPAVAGPTPTAGTARPGPQTRPGRPRVQSRSGGRLWAAAEARRTDTESDSDSDTAEDAVHEAEEAVLADLAKLAAERDDYLDQLRRTKADFENYRKRILRQQTEHLERAAEALAEKLLPVLDTFDAALAHGEGFEQVYAALMSTLEKEGLERIAPEGKPFDPNESDAVAHEEGDDGPVVAEVLRPGYRWKGRVLRPAMVRVRG
jgi:molecular chaperone GrpE